MMQHDLVTVAHITAWHLILILLGVVPLRRYLPKSDLLLLAALSYVLNGFLLIVLSYGLDLAGVFSPLGVWIVWLALWTVSFLLPRPGWGTWVCDFDTSGYRIWVVIATIIAAWVRLYDAMIHVSPACLDTYVLTGHLVGVLSRGAAHVAYLAGFQVLSAVLQIDISPPDIMRFAPQVTAILGIPIAFAFWRLIVGARAASWAPSW